MKINLVIIVKNEERSLRKCLKAAKPLVDEIILADTGSSDKTLEIAREFGAVIREFPWINDFRRPAILPWNSRTVTGILCWMRMNIW